MTEKPEDYPYSSFRAYIFPKEETIVFRDLIWDMVSGERKNAPQRYREYVESGPSQRKPEVPLWGYMEELSRF